MPLPLVLAGPIVRRVEPQLASVWVALSERSNVQLELFEGRVQAGSGPPLFQGVSSPATRAGKNLYFAVATVDLQGTPSSLLSGQTYSYNLRFDGNRDLNSLELLKDREEKEENGVLIQKGHEALGYDQGSLPSFVMPPSELTDLCLIHGSCRRPQVPTPDAMVWIDDFIEAGIRSPETAQPKRPHQLFLTGDQIYADDVAAPMLHMIGKRCDEVIGGVEKMPAAEENYPIDFDNFPVRLRKNFTISEAKFTSADGENHLLSFAEFCLMYLFVWSNELWPDRLPTLPEMLSFPPGFPSAIWKLHTGLGDSMTPVSLKSFRDELCKTMAKGYHRQREVMTAFRTGLPKVRRALANVATYMIFDDHEITDDWNLNEAWVRRVNSSPSGGAIIRNGLLAYGLCQGWGNDPRQFTADIVTENGLKPTTQKELLSKIEKLFSSDTGEMNNTVAGEIEKLLGLTAVPPEVVTWNYSVPGPKHKVVSLDLRTRRGRNPQIAAPENLTVEALNDQLPARPVDGGPEVLVVLSSLTVLGPPVIDALLGPVLYKIFDLKSYIKHRDRRQLSGLDPDAIESWPNHDDAFERLLERLSTYGKVVLLSGDVHFATSVAMTQFPKGAPPMRIAQFTASAMKNLFKEEIRNAAQYFNFLQRVIAQKIDVERVIWEKKNPSPLNLSGVPVPRLVERLNKAPVRLPTHGWPSGTRQKPELPPDRAWRVHIPRDGRADRPEGAMTPPLVPDNPSADITFDLSGYRLAAKKHAAELHNINHDRQMVFASNLGVVTFQQTGDGLRAIQDLYALHKAPFDKEPKAYTRHEISLSADPAEVIPQVRGD